MGTFRLNSDEIKLMALFEKLTHAKIADCMQDESNVVFIVQKGDVGLAVGKKGVNVQKIRESLGKNVQVVEDADTPEQFIKNIFHPTEIKQVTINDAPEGKTAEINVKRSDRSRVIGPEGSKIKLAKKLVERHYQIKDITIRTNG